ncbi:MAG: GNAT family N-acetyltransferase [Bacteroidales bacterium]|nr:GNAT family N-acetyltransferase [Bacteroidales bacterium]
MIIKEYTPLDAPTWDKAVAESRNGTFLHMRGYMDYHADRFADCSLLALDDHNRVLAVLPAHAADTEVASHRGLSFGGWLMTARADMPAMMQIWNEASRHYADRGFTSLDYRPVPHIYHRYPAEEDLYALFRAGATLRSTLVSSTTDLSAPLQFDSNARRAMRRALAAGVECHVSTDFAAFWPILSACLAERHAATPVHTLAEITLLASRFPQNIVLYLATLAGRPCAGVVMYLSHPVAHCQYIASDEEARAVGALPLLFSRIQADATAAGYRWLDYGTSCEDAGRILNTGLIRQKCGFGARAIAFNSFNVTL